MSCRPRRTLWRRPPVLAAPASGTSNTCRPTTLRTTVPPTARSAGCSPYGCTCPCSSSGECRRRARRGRHVETAVRLVVAVADPAGGAWVSSTSTSRPSRARRQRARRAKRAGAARLLALAVLVRPVAVTRAAAQSGDAQPGDVDHPAVGIDGARRPGRRLRQAGSQDQPASERAVAVHVGVVVARDEHQRAVEDVHQRAQVVERQVAAGQDEIDVARTSGVGVKRLVDLVGDCEHPDHPSSVTREVGHRHPRGADRPRRGRSPRG